MKKTIFAALMAVCLMAGSSVFAQDGKKAHMPKEKMTVEQMAKMRTEKMTQALKLDEKQAKQVYDYNMWQIKDMQSKHEQMKADRMASAEKMKTILTPEQYAQWEQMSGPKYMGKQGKCCKSGKMDKGDGCCKGDKKDMDGKHKQKK